MWLVLLLIAAAFLWFGVEAFSLAQHASPPKQIDKDEMMFGKAHKRPVSEWARSFIERRYPIATSGSAMIYGALLIALGLLFTLLALRDLIGAV